MRLFAAYPSIPNEVAQSIEIAEKQNSSHVQFDTWRSKFGAGRLIDKNVLPCIEQSDGLICDITIPNNNVYFEIGYAIGLEKPIVPIINSSISTAGSYLRRLGILDNVGQIRYENSDDLLNKIEFHRLGGPIFVGGANKVSSQPVLVLDSLRRNEVSTKLISAVKACMKFYRTIDPQEEYRLSARVAWDLLTESTGVIVTIFSPGRDDWELHNIRASFLAGMAVARDLECLILADPDASKPLDFIDICKTIKHPDEIRDAVQSMLPKLYKRQVGVERADRKKGKRLISSITVGSNAAENEMKDLKYYFVETHDFKNALEGRGRLIVGRKGSGKTAIFWRVRDIARKSPGKELVLDLKPDGYQLRKFKEQLIKFLAIGTKEHTLTAFWEYIIYSEIVHKIFESDYHKFYGKNPALTLLLDELRPIKEKLFDAREGDFSERMIGLIRQVGERFKERNPGEEPAVLHVDQVTELLYAVGIRDIHKKVLEYLGKCDRGLVLVDNVDKGWGAHGVDDDDILVVSTLIDALRKVERQAAKVDARVDWLLFLRNDVFELLVDRQNDRGKDGKIIVDWDSRAVLAKVIHERIHSSGYDLYKREVKWSEIAVPIVDGVESLDWMIERTLMRPRYLIQLCDECIGHADSSGHEIIEASDFHEGFRKFSLDIIGNTNYEMRDIAPETEDSIYTLIGSSRCSTIGDIKNLLTRDGYSSDVIEKIIDLFFWFAVLGADAPNRGEAYIYDYRYDAKIFNKIRRKELGDQERVYINMAFSKGLGCVL